MSVPVSNERLAVRIENLQADLAKNISDHARKMRVEALSLLQELQSRRRDSDRVTGEDLGAVDVDLG